jgi:hypothetical protein
LALLNPFLEEVTHTEKDTVGASAINFTKELLFNPKQDALSSAVHDLFVLPVVLPHAPLKSQIEEALAQSDVEGMVVLHAGNAGGCGAGVLLKVMDHETRLPALPGVLLSSMHNFQVPFGFCPLFTAPKCPSGKKEPVNGAAPNLIGVLAEALKQVLV